jgi:hypothetical protein
VVVFTDGSGDTGNDGVARLGDSGNTDSFGGREPICGELLKLHSLLLSPRQPPLPMQ